MIHRSSSSFIRSALSTIFALLTTQIVTPSAHAGLGFGPPRALNWDAESDNQLRFSSDSHPVVSHGPGGWLCVWLTSCEAMAGHSHTYFSRSSDDGRYWVRGAWIDPKSDQDPAIESCPRICSGALEHGIWLAVWSHRSTVGGPLGTDADVLFARLLSHGGCWSPPAALNSYAYKDGANDHDFIPDTSTDSKGTWIVVWESDWPQDGLSGFDSDLYTARSVDNGESWSDAALLYRGGMNDSGEDVRPRICTDSNGTWIVVWFSEDDGQGRWGTDWDILYVRSEDNGLTWSSPLPLNTNAAQDGAQDRYPQIAGDGYGNWVVTWAAEGRSGPDWDVYFSHSEDDGRTWSESRLLHSDGLDDGADDRATDIATDGKDWLIAWVDSHLTGGGQAMEKDIAVSRSTDGGRTWGEPSYANSNAASDSGSDLDPSITTDGNGNWMIVWTSTEDYWGTTFIDGDIFVATSGNLDAVPHDADGDGIDDTLEEDGRPYKHFTHRELPDTDGDGLSDGTEDANRNGVHSEAGETHTRSRDTDGDGYEDGIEVILLASDPRDAARPEAPFNDFDRDALPESMDPDGRDSDTDGDRFLDGYEAVVLALVAVTDSSRLPSLGDVDGNGLRDNADAQSTLNYFAGRMAPSILPSRADVERGGSIDNADAQVILNFMAEICFLPYQLPK